jgi:hypothetical protein
MYAAPTGRQRPAPENFCFPRQSEGRSDALFISQIGADHPWPDERCSRALFPGRVNRSRKAVGRRTPGGSRRARSAGRRLDGHRRRHRAGTRQATRRSVASRGGGIGKEPLGKLEVVGRGVLFVPCGMVDPANAAIEKSTGNSATNLLVNAAHTHHAPQCHRVARLRSQEKAWGRFHVDGRRRANLLPHRQVWPPAQRLLVEEAASSARAWAG